MPERGRLNFVCKIIKKKNHSNSIIHVFRIQNLKENSVDPDKAAHNELPHLDLHCLQIRLFFFLNLLCVNKKLSVLITKFSLFSIALLFLCDLDPFCLILTSVRLKCYAMLISTYDFKLVVYLLDFIFSMLDSNSSISILFYWCAEAKVLI